MQKSKPILCKSFTNTLCICWNSVAKYVYKLNQKLKNKFWDEIAENTQQRKLT